MMRPNMRQGPAASVGVPAPEKASAAMGDDYKTGTGCCDGATEEQARAIICTANRAVEEEAYGGRLSIKKSLEWFLERRRKTAAAGVHRRHHEESSSSSSD